jgi:flagellar motor switch protein FliG
MIDNTDGFQKSILLLISMNEIEAIETLKNLNISEISQIIDFIVRNNEINFLNIHNVLKGYKKKHQKYLKDHLIKKKYFQSLLIKKDLFKNVSKSFLINNDVFEIHKKLVKKFNSIHSNDVKNYIQHEHPQIISIILISLNYIHASNILLDFKKSRRNEIIKRIYLFKKFHMSGLVNLNDFMKNLLKNKKKIELKNKNIQIFSKILKLLRSSNKK